MKLQAFGEKIILQRIEQPFGRHVPLGLGGAPLALPARDPNDKKHPALFGRIVSVGPDHDGPPLRPGQIVVFSAAAIFELVDGVEYCGTVSGNIIMIESDAGEIEVATPFRTMASSDVDWASP